MSFKDMENAGENSSPAFFEKDELNHLLYPACIITSKGYLEHANRTFAELFSLGPEENNRKFDWSGAFTDQCRKEIAQAFVKSLNGAFTCCAAEVNQSDGKASKVRVIMQPVVKDGLVDSVFIIIHDHEEDSPSSGFEAESICDDSALTDHYEYIPLPFIRFNRKLEVVKCSRAFEGTIGYSLDEMSKENGKKLSAIFKYDAERIKNSMSEILEGNIPFRRIGEIKVTGRNDEERIVNIVVYPIMKDDEICAIDLMMEDITRLKELRSRLSTAKRLNLVSDIGKGFIHGINNTVNVILNQTQLLQRISEKESVSKGLVQIEDYIHEIAEQIRRIYSFLDEGYESSAESEELFGNIVNDAVEFVRIHFKVDESRRSRNISIEKKCDYDINVKTNTKFIRELFIWAMLRVAAHLDKKGLINAVLEKSNFYCLTFSAEKPEGAESGNIIPFTLDGYSPSEMRSEAEKLNLKIIEEESVDLYAIRIIFPSKIIIENTAEAEKKGDLVIEDRDIMIVEDEQALQMILGNLFERMGNRVFITDNGSVALEEFRRKNYDIILADYDIEGLTGIELSARVKELNEDTLTVLLSGWSIENLAGYDSFIDLFMAKPFDINDLLKGIASLSPAGRK